MIQGSTLPLHPLMPLATSLTASLDSAETAIRRVVMRFYDKAKRDELMGPIFMQAIGDNWDAHLDLMCDFWSTVLFHTARYKGQPMLAHARIPEISPLHFERWLKLFVETVHEECDETLGAMFIERATRMRENLERALMRLRAEGVAGNVYA